MKTPVTRNTLAYHVFPCPFGLMGIAVSQRGLRRLRIDLKRKDEFIKILKSLYDETPVYSPEELKDYQNQFEEYFAGTRKDFTFPLDLNEGTPFQTKVWQVLSHIPYGITRSYEWLAQEIDNPQAARATGSANGKNPVPIVVPCHRIIKKDGSLGGYTGGTHIKQYLLNLEMGTNGSV